MSTPPAIDAESALASRAGLPPGATWLRELFAAAPWREHPNFGALAGFWQQVHRELRGEGRELASLLDRYREGGHDPATFERAFANTLGRYLQHLDVHHRVEDTHYFPRFRSLDARLVAGFDLLENDHEVIHAQLVAVADSGNALLRRLRTAEDCRPLLDAHALAAERLISLLDRHLADEEELVIPAILHFGEAPLA